MKEFNFEVMPIVDIVNEIILDAVNKNASDIHFDPAENYLKVRIRIDGELQDYSMIDNKYKRNLNTRVKLLAGMNITETRLPQDGAIKSRIGNKDVDLRVSALPTNFGEKIVVRILDYSMSLNGIESLEFTKENFDKIEKMLESPNGIILVTGATGSGKTTTVYSMLQRLNKEETNIITVEDPIEMDIEGINQVQVNPEIGLDFATVLRSILRQDPNVIVIGEIRDSETAKIAIRASITGHLVLSTLHTNNSLTTIERLLDMDVERYLLASSLKGIISQNLAKRLCPDCLEERPTTDIEKRIFKKILNLDVDKIYDSKGCKNCRNGYSGRIAVQEVLIINDEIREAINNHMERSALKKLIYRKNVKTLLQDGLIKVLEGKTSLSEVLRLVDIDDIFINSYEEGEKPVVNYEPNVKIKATPAKNSYNVFDKLRVDDQNVETNNKQVTPVEIKPSTINSAPVKSNLYIDSDNDDSVNKKAIKDPNYSDINEIISRYNLGQQPAKPENRTKNLIDMINNDILKENA